MTTAHDAAATLEPSGVAVHAGAWRRSLLAAALVGAFWCARSATMTPVYSG